MKMMSKQLTAKEIVLVIVLAVMLLGLAYYKFVYINIKDAVASAKADESALQTELEAAQLRTGKIKKMQKELEGINSTGILTKMGSYNNSKPETAFLNTVLAGVDDYNIGFDEVTRDGDQIRRNFNLQYKTSSYAAAKKIMKELTSGDYRCLIGDVNCSVDTNGATTITLDGTFYETMVGGTPDSALPKDEAATTEELDPTVEAAYAK
ncbi:MAG: hypothetical protein IKE74_01010 [Mogibacterium sp.]|nr:hypothetical protein [Mogibacterium sp.]